MKIISDDRPGTNWVTAIVDDRWCQAKLFDEGSVFGIKGGRISKLCVAKIGVKELGMHTGLNFLDNLDFNYDRGLDFDDLPDGVLDNIVSHFESLPKAY